MDECSEAPKVVTFKRMAVLKVGDFEGGINVYKK